MSVGEVQRENDYASVHRDIAAGMMAGDLFRSGYFGKNVEVFGAVCAKEGKNELLYGFDAMAVALKGYQNMQDGAQIVALPKKSYHLAMEDKDESVIESFQKFVEESVQCDITAAEPVEKTCPQNFWAGFAYEKDGKRKTFINGYFPRVLEEYLALTDAKVTPIVFKETAGFNIDKKQIVAEIEQILAETVL